VPLGSVAACALFGDSIKGKTMKLSQGNSMVKKNQEFLAVVPIPTNHNDATAQLSTPVRDLADLLAQMAVEKIMQSLPTRAQLGEGGNTK
jgi:hypothetical protein